MKWLVKIPVIVLYLYSSSPLYAQRLYDLSHTMDAYEMDSSTWSSYLIKPKSDQSFVQNPKSKDKVVYLAKYMQSTHGFLSGELILPDHRSTHIDAPNHFLLKPASDQGHPRKSIGEITIEDLVGTPFVLDVSERQDKTVYAQDILNIKEELKASDFLIVHFGLSSIYGSIGYLAPTSPGFSQEACSTIAELIDKKEISIKAVGADNAGVDKMDNFQKMESSCHHQLLSRNVMLIENMNIPKEFANESDCKMILAPLPIIGSSGSPARIISLCN